MDESFREKVKEKKYYVWTQGILALKVEKMSS